MTQAQTTPWTPNQKIGFRFTFCYLFLFIFPFPLYYIPFTDGFTRFYTGLWHRFVPWVGENILYIENGINTSSTGSSDTTYNYVQILIFFVFSIIATIVWTLLDRNRKHYRIFLKWFTISIVYFLAFTMLRYGFSKVFCLQFPKPPFYSLIKPYGYSSPMGLAWVFMGASKTYSMFSGWIEVIGGLLLLYRQTRTLGALIILGVMLNVFMLNMSYDIPVKLLSFHLMMIAFLFILLDGRRLINLFILNKPTITRPLTRYFKNSKFNKGALILHILIIGYILFSQIDRNIERSRERTVKPFFYGIYNVETFVINNDTIPPLLTDRIRWRSIYNDDMHFSKYMIATNMRGWSQWWFEFKLDSINNKLKMTDSRDSTNVYDLHYIKTDSTLFFKGTWKTDSIEVKMNKFDLKRFELINRGFHWINEYPRSF